MIFGLHIHIGCRSGDRCIQMFHEFLHHFPYLMALSASSPFFQGEDTGLASSRIMVFEGIPTAGHPLQVPSWLEFESLVNDLFTSKSISSLKDLWWDLRPSPGYGTLEIRACDGMATIAETVALTALVHCLAIESDAAIQHGKGRPLPNDWIVRENKWRASRHGLDALIVSSPEKCELARDGLMQMLARLEPLSRSFGYQKQFDLIESLIHHGPSYLRQKQVFEATGNLQEVSRQVASEFENDSPHFGQILG